MRAIFKRASLIRSIPLLDRIVAPANHVPAPEILTGYLKSQRLAQEAVRKVAGMMQEGWTEIQAAKMVETYLRDSGVSAFFHLPFAWFGERTRFEGITNYVQYAPSKRVLLPNEVFILDVAPIYHGYIADIGYTASLTPHPTLNKSKAFLTQLREEIPTLFLQKMDGTHVWNSLDEKIRAAGYLNIHKKYPFSVLGHRVHQTNEYLPHLKLLNFGWQSYWSLLSRGLFGQLLNGDFAGDLQGLWAIEPHLGDKHFGAKFEEILVVDKSKAYWLETIPQFGEHFL